MKLASGTDKKPPSDNAPGLSIQNQDINSASYFKR
jgi:hypothetical protein